MTLKEAREAVGLSQSALDRLAKVSKNTVHDLEKGHNQDPAFSVVEGIIGALRRAGLKNITAEQIFSTKGVV